MQTQQPILTDCNNCGSTDHREYACACACHAARHRIVRSYDKTALALRLILKDARHEQEVSLLAHAISTGADRDEALWWSVAASAAVDVALRALTSYVANGDYYPSTSCGPESTPLHEQCRLARCAVDAKIAEVFAAKSVHEPELSPWERFS